jgi:DNA-binding MarR family transcriptional regulator
MEKIKIKRLFGLHEIGLAILITLYQKKNEQNNLPQKGKSKQNKLYVSKLLVLGYTYANIWINVKRLESLGLVITNKKANTREKYIELTPKGEELAKKLVDALGLLEGLDEKS